MTYIYPPMIVRPQLHWFRRLFVWHGSVLKDILFRLTLNLLMSVVAIYCFHWYEELGVKLTQTPFGLLGISIAIFLGFRNSVSYARFVEARLLWGNLIITQRSLLRQVKSLLPPGDPRVAEFVQLMIAFSFSLKHQLRRTDEHADLQRLLPESVYRQVTAGGSACNRLLLLMGNWLAEQRQNGSFSDIIYQGIDNNINHLTEVLGGCERLANTPLPFAYGVILHRTVYLFCTLLPFALVADLHFMTPIVSVFISYTFISLDALAEQLEDPFGTADNDLPLDALCNNTEIVLLSMNDEMQLPPRMQPDHQFNLN